MVLANHVAVAEHREATSGCAAVVKPSTAGYQLYPALRVYDRFAIGRSLAVLGHCYEIGLLYTIESPTEDQGT